MEERQRKKLDVYHVNLVGKSDEEYAKINGFNGSGIIQVDELDEIKDIIEKSWGTAFFDLTRSDAKTDSDSRTYYYISRNNSYASISLKPRYPYKSIHIRLASLLEKSLEDDLESFRLKYNKDKLRLGHPF